MADTVTKKLSEMEVDGVALVPASSSFSMSAHSVLADLMELFGADANKIHGSTGFARDVSGKWAKAIPSKTLTEYVDDIAVTTKDDVRDPSGRKLQGLYNPAYEGMPGSIELSNKTNDMRQTTRHEILHHAEMGGINMAEQKARMGFVGVNESGKELYKHYDERPTEIQAHLLEYFSEDHLKDGKYILEALQSKPQNVSEAKAIAEIIVKRNAMPLKAWKEIYPDKTPVELMNHLAQFHMDRFSKSDVKTKKLITGGK